MPAQDRWDGLGRRLPCGCVCRQVGLLEILSMFIKAVIAIAACLEAYVEMQQNHPSQLFCNFTIASAKFVVDNHTHAINSLTPGACNLEIKQTSKIS